MNINDISTHFKKPDDMLIEIFNKQKVLMEKYHIIEAPMRLTQDCPVDLNDPKGQLLLKDYAWRTTEEIGEAFAALEDKEAEEHIQEEIVDALHFLVEMGILANITTDDLMPEWAEDYNAKADTLEEIYKANYAEILSLEKCFKWGIVYRFIIDLSMVCHTLKNKPWKQTHMLTDKAEFKKRYVKAFYSFINLANVMNIEPESLYLLYCKKNEVNQFRQESKY
jgi:dimeric dUTPase (all-alpha-NTP-PPase superfamily)